jgi:hypothetical protein
MPTFTVRVVSDYHNLIIFITTKNLNRRQARWAIELSVFNFIIFYRRSKENPADRPSRRSDYAIVDPEEENPLHELI